MEGSIRPRGFLCICLCGTLVPASLVTQKVKRRPAMQETWVWSLHWEDPLEKEKATHSSTLAWKIPWTESLVGYSPWNCKESDTTEWLHFHFLRDSSPGEAGRIWEKKVAHSVTPGRNGVDGILWEQRRPVCSARWSPRELENPGVPIAQHAGEVTTWNISVDRLGVSSQHFLEPQREAEGKKKKYPQMWPAEGSWLDEAGWLWSAPTDDQKPYRDGDVCRKLCAQVPRQDWKPVLCHLSHPPKAYKPLTSEASWEKGGGMVCFQHVEEKKRNKINCLCLYIKYEESYVSYVWVHGMKYIPITNWLLCRNSKNASAGCICEIDHLRNSGPGKQIFTNQ